MRAQCCTETPNFDKTNMQIETTHTHTHPKLDKEEPILRSPLKEILQTSVFLREFIGNVTNINCLKDMKIHTLIQNSRVHITKDREMERGKREGTEREVRQLFELCNNVRERVKDLKKEGVIVKESKIFNII